MRVDHGLQLHLLLLHVHRWIQSGYFAILKPYFVPERVSYLSAFLFPAAVNPPSGNRVGQLDLVVLPNSPPILFDYQYYDSLEWKNEEKKFIFLYPAFAFLHCKGFLFLIIVLYHFFTLSVVFLTEQVPFYIVIYNCCLMFSRVFLLFIHIGIILSSIEASGCQTLPCTLILNVATPVWRVLSGPVTASKRSSSRGTQFFFFLWFNDTKQHSKQCVGTLRWDDWSWMLVLILCWKNLIQMLSILMFGFLF